ncbi:MAG TPA: CU044_2847 family protein [Chloroflexia bacterium]|nr:CU044_2847 family protein [Chloroflexia bacterium]
MKRVIEFPMDNGEMLLVEVEDAGGSSSTLRGGHSTAMIERARVTYEQAIDSIRPAAESIIVRMRELVEPPDVIDLEFGIKLSADIGAFLASTSAEAQFTLKLTWNRRLLRTLPDNNHSAASENASNSSED